VSGAAATAWPKSRAPLLLLQCIFAKSLLIFQGTASLPTMHAFMHRQQCLYNGAALVPPLLLQPWRTDLGGCARMAAFAVAGHREERVVQLLAADPAYVEGVCVRMCVQVCQYVWRRCCAVLYRLCLLCPLLHGHQVRERCGACKAF
jgi:hypothetical protein